MKLHSHKSIHIKPMWVRLMLWLTALTGSLNALAQGDFTPPNLVGDIFSESGEDGGGSGFLDTLACDWGTPILLIIALAVAIVVVVVVLRKFSDSAEGQRGGGTGAMGVGAWIIIAALVFLFCIAVMVIGDNMLDGYCGAE